MQVLSEEIARLRVRILGRGRVVFDVMTEIDDRAPRSVVSVIGAGIDLDADQGHILRRTCPIRA